MANVFAIELGRTQREAARVLNLGSLYLLAVAQIGATCDDPRGLLYLTPAGDMLLVNADDDAPADASYVGSIGPRVDPLFIAARLRYVAANG